VNSPAGPDSTEGDAGLLTSQPPAQFTAVREWVLDTVAELRGFRVELQHEINARAHTDADRPLPDVASSLVLVASELATNGIRHGRPPTIVVLHEHDGRFLLTVADHDLSTEPRIAGDRPPGHGGFGLQIARRLAVNVGWYRTDEVKVVWAEIGD
jgi:serine/threonine-protein kinase RsbW